MDITISSSVRFQNKELSEDIINDILTRASNTLDIDFSGSNLMNDIPLFIVDWISHNNFYNFCSINLNGTNISSRSFDVMMDTVACSKDLKALHVRGNGLPKEAGMAMAKVIGARAGLEVLDAAENRLGDAGIAAIAGCFTADLSEISNNTPVSLLSLAVLDLSNNDFGDAGVLALCRGLTYFSKTASSMHRRSNLRVLKLNNNKFGDKGAICLATFLDTCCTTGCYNLEEISVSNNVITGTGLHHLLLAVGDSSSLLKVGLKHCAPDVDSLESLVSVVHQQKSSIRIIEFDMWEQDALQLLADERALDIIVRLSDAVAGNGNIALMSLGELPDVTRKAVLRATAGSPDYYRLRIMMDCFRSMIEVLKMASSQERELISSLESGQPSVIQLQQREFEKLRREHSVSFTIA
jgi:hypothetical protein